MTLCIRRTLDWNCPGGVIQVRTVRRLTREQRGVDVSKRAVDNFIRSPPQNLSGSKPSLEEQTAHGEKWTLTPGCKGRTWARRGYHHTMACKARKREFLLTKARSEELRAAEAVVVVVVGVCGCGGAGGGERRRSGGGEEEVCVCVVVVVGVVICGGGGSDDRRSRRVHPGYQAHDAANSEGHVPVDTTHTALFSVYRAQKKSTAGLSP